MTAMKTNFVYVTYIRSTPEKVFAALTDAEITKRYWGHENVSDWRPGSRWEHVRDNEERRVNIAGKVIESDPPRRLVVSWSSAADFDDAEKHSRVTYELVEAKDMVRLTVSHDDLEVGSGMEKGVTKGWPRVLSSLKSYLETGEGIDVFADVA